MKLCTSFLPHLCPSQVALKLSFPQRHTQTHFFLAAEVIPKKKMWTLLDCFGVQPSNPELKLKKPGQSLQLTRNGAGVTMTNYPTMNQKLAGKLDGPGRPERIRPKRPFFCEVVGPTLLQTSVQLPTFRRAKQCRKITPCCGRSWCNVMSEVCFLEWNNCWNSNNLQGQVPRWASPKCFRAGLHLELVGGISIQNLAATWRPSPKTQVLMATKISFGWFWIGYCKCLLTLKVDTWSILSTFWKRTGIDRHVPRFSWFKMVQDWNETKKQKLGGLSFKGDCETLPQHKAAPVLFSPGAQHADAQLNPGDFHQFHQQQFGKEATPTWNIHVHCRHEKIQCCRCITQQVVWRHAIMKWSGLYQAKRRKSEHGFIANMFDHKSNGFRLYKWRNKSKTTATTHPAPVLVILARICKTSKLRPASLVAVNSITQQNRLLSVSDDLLQFWGIQNHLYLSSCNFFTSITVCNPRNAILQLFDPTFSSPTFFVLPR